MKRTIERLRAEFLEMPGLRLNVKQVQRLCGVDAELCQDVLDALVDRCSGTSRTSAEADFWKTSRNRRSTVRNRARLSRR